MLSRRMFRAPLAALLGGSVIVIGAATVLATIPDTGGVIHGCFQQNNGQLRVIDPSVDRCLPSESAISWNQNGSQGPAGPTGPQGPQGPAGPSNAYEAFNPDFIFLTGSNPGTANSIATVNNLPAGAYTITVSVLGNAHGGFGRIVCLAVAGGRSMYLISSIGNGVDQVMLATAFTAVVQSDGGQANLSCWLENGPGPALPFLAYGDIVAVKVGARTLTQVSS